jgi:hypothetical protein
VFEGAAVTQPAQVYVSRCPKRFNFCLIGAIATTNSEVLEGNYPVPARVHVEIGKGRPARDRPKLLNIDLVSGEAVSRPTAFLVFADRAKIGRPAAKAAKMYCHINRIPAYGRPADRRQVAVNAVVPDCRKLEAAHGGGRPVVVDSMQWSERG